MERRSFLKWATHGLGALFGAILGVPALAYLIDGRNRPAPASDFKTVALLKDLPEGVPQQVVLRDVRTDAWTLHPDDLVGRVWLVRNKDEVTAFTTICPHLGCSINYEANDNQFACPCHGAVYRLDGKRETGPQPRGMDTLECRRDPTDANLIQVKYQNFMQGIEEKVAKS
jgi:menaquinol-cytochrome c reductase iron-sulfur subunit